MKRFLLLLLVLIITDSTYAQVVDIIGKGVKGLSSSNLIIPDIDNVEKVEVGAFYKGGSTIPKDDAVKFKNFKPELSSKWNTDIIIKNSESLTIGYFSENYDEVDASGIDIFIEPIDRIHSFYILNDFSNNLAYRYIRFFQRRPQCH